MSKERPTIGTDGKVLPLLPPTRDARVCARMVRVMFYTPGFMAVLLLKTGEPTGFGISIELLMLASAAAAAAARHRKLSCCRKRLPSNEMAHPATASRVCSGGGGGAGGAVRVSPARSIFDLRA